MGAGVPMRAPYLSRKDSEHNLAARPRVPQRRRFIADEGNLPIREPNELGLSLSPTADARGFPTSLTLLSRRTVKEESTPRIENPRLERKLQQQLRAKTLETEILREALE